MSGDEDDEDDHCYKMGLLLGTRVPMGTFLVIWVPFSCFGSPFSILDWITQRIAVRTIVESSQNQCKDGRTECPFPPRCGSAYENWPPLCNFEMLILCLKFNFDSVSLLFNRFALCELFWKIELWVPFYIIWVPFWSPLCLKLGPLWVPFLGFLGPLLIV